MRTRLDLDKELRSALGSDNVYFQPPESVRMQYPAIVYSRYNISQHHADNFAYMQSPAYQITVIDPDPDSKIWERVSLIPMCSYDRNFKSDNLNHDVFTVFL